MIDAKRLFKPGRRYRGFAPIGGRYVPVGFNLYPINTKEVRIRYLFPPRVGERIREGSVLYVLVEDERKLVAEIRVVRKGEKEVVANLDFVTEDKRKLPRVKVEGFLEIEASLSCGGKAYTGKVVDLSLSSVSVRTELIPTSEECELSVKYRNTFLKLKGRVVRREEGVAVLEILNGNNEMAELLQRIYADLFLKAQRAT